MLLREPPERLVHVAVSAAAAAVERRRLRRTRPTATGSSPSKRRTRSRSAVLDALKRRRLPFTGEDIELLLDLGTTTMRPDRILGRSYETLSFGLAAARHLLEREPGSPPVLGGLGRAGRRPRRPRPHRAEAGAAPTADPRARRRTAPGGLLDLSLLDGRDGWAEPVADALRRHAAEWDDAQQLVALLAARDGQRARRAPGGGAPASSPASYAGYGELLRGLLEPLLSIELVSVGRSAAAGVARRAGERDARARRGLGGRRRRRAVGRPAPRPACAAERRALAASEGDDGALPPGGERRDRGARRDRDPDGPRGAPPAARRGAAPRSGEADRGGGRRSRRTRPSRATIDCAARSAGSLQLIADPEPKARQRAASAYVRQRPRADARARRASTTPPGGPSGRLGTTGSRCSTARRGRAGCRSSSAIWFRFVPRADLPCRSRRPAAARQGRTATCAAACRSRATASRRPAAASALWFARWRPLDAVLRALREGRSRTTRSGGARPTRPSHRLLTGYVARESGNASSRAGSSRSQPPTTAASSTSADEERERTPEWKAWVEALEADAARA